MGLWVAAISNRPAMPLLKHSLKESTLSRELILHFTMLQDKDADFDALKGRA
jgi:hypothetical protein